MTMVSVLIVVYVVTGGWNAGTDRMRQIVVSNI